MDEDLADAKTETGQAAMRVIDAHCHLDDFEDLPAVLDRARAAGVIHLVVNGLWRAPGDFGHALALARRDPARISATVAIHPHDASRAAQADFELVRQIARDQAIRAIGETGLDFHYDFSPPGAQREVMRWHIRLAREIAKPLVLHVREAHGDAFDIFREEGARDIPTQVHCFTGTPDEARAWIDLGCYLSFSGALTFRSGGDIRDAARLVPAERLLVETDSPYLAPVPHRGKRCEPAFVTETLRCLAQVRGVSVEEMAALTARNAQRLFAIPDSAIGSAFAAERTAE